MRLGLKLTRPAAPPLAPEAEPGAEQRAGQMVLPPVAAGAASATPTAGLPAVRGGLARLVPLPAPVRPPLPSTRALSFIALVLLPVAIAAAYYFAVAADQYVVAKSANQHIVAALTE